MNKSLSTFLTFLVLTSVSSLFSGCGSKQNSSTTILGLEEPLRLAKYSDDLKESTASNLTGQASLDLKKVSTADLPKLTPDGDISKFKLALERQLDRCSKLNQSQTWLFGTRTVTRQKWCVDTTKAFLGFIKTEGTMEKVWAKAKSELEWYKSTGKTYKHDVQFTGYYLPRIQVKRKKDAKFNYPFYNVPPELERKKINGRSRWGFLNPLTKVFGAFYSREEIDFQGKNFEGAISNRNLEIAYTDDMIEAFFVHIQGSAAAYVNNPDGTETRMIVGYAAQNGHGYEGIGGILKSEGINGKYLSLQGLRKYFRDFPSEINRVFPMNPSYIFFKERPTDPYGSGGTPLVPGHSIATDNKVFPLGAIALIKTQRPQDHIADTVTHPSELKWNSFTRLMVNQDTGGAIKGPGRVDVYWGDGRYAEFAAGGLNDRNGELYFAVVPETDPASIAKN